MRAQCIETSCGQWFDIQNQTRTAARCPLCRRRRRTAQQAEYREKLKQAGIGRFKHYKNGHECMIRGTTEHAQTIRRDSLITRSELLHLPIKKSIDAINAILRGEKGLV